VFHLDGPVPTLLKLVAVVLGGGKGRRADFLRTVLMGQFPTPVALIDPISIGVLLLNRRGIRLYLLAHRECSRIILF
jgi:hypothetical protein